MLGRINFIVFIFVTGSDHGRVIILFKAEGSILVFIFLREPPAPKLSMFCSRYFAVLVGIDVLEMFFPFFVRERRAG